MKKLLSLLTTFSLSSAIGINVIGCQTNPFDDFPGNNQVAKTAAPAVINAVNNFLMYNVLYMKGDSVAENKFYYNYQNISQNQWMRYPSLEL
ncbi:lipoprotein [Spiroplasma endosymbiont of Ammophila pubescens]|uniref:lipoprotein n=1 Tax=Spiroplasma endosymbiont of Ammophila pubescens TaxID=3066315 RepID=UPI0032B28F56